MQKTCQEEEPIYVCVTSWQKSLKERDHRGKVKPSKEWQKLRNPSGQGYVCMCQTQEELHLYVVQFVGLKNINQTVIKINENTEVHTSTWF